MQTTFLCKPRANLLKKVSKHSEKNMNVHLSLHQLYIKFHGQIHLTLAITIKTKNLTNSNSSNTPKFVFFCNC
jgi:hypothetical protein